MHRTFMFGIGGLLIGTLVGLVAGRATQLVEPGPEASPLAAPLPRSPSSVDGTPARPATLEEAHRQLAQLQSRADAQAHELTALRSGNSGTASREDRVPHGAAGTTPATGAPVALPAKSPAEVTARIEAIRGEIESAFEQRDGRRALALLTELGGLGPAAYPLAIEVYNRIEREGEGASGLNLSRYALYKVLGSDAFVPVLQWAVTNPEVDRGFRHRAAGTLVWTDATDTAALFLRQMETEKDPGMLEEMADSVAEIREPASLPGLIDMFARRPDAPELRLSLIGAIEQFEDATVDQKLQSLSAVDPDPAVRAAASVALIGRNPPVPGYLISQVFDGTQATRIGLHAGDLIVRYNDVPLTSREDLGRVARSVSPEQEASLLILRQGQYLTIGLKGGRIGIDGRAVQPR